MGNARHVVLSESYRSAPHVLDVVNHVFQKPEQMGVRSEIHQAFRKEVKGSVTLWPLIEKEDGPSKASWVLPTTQTKQFLPRRALAQQIANQISSWLLNKTRLESRGRSIEPRDIMILVRRRDAFMDEIVRTLKAKSVPVSGLDRLSLNDHIAVQDVLCLVDVLLLPDDDLRLATLLKSPFFGVSDAHLATLCARPEDVSLWTTLSKHPDYKEIYEQLMAWDHLLQQASSLEDFFYDILYRQDYRKKFVARLGPDVDDVFSALLESASSFEEQHGPHAALFISWVRQQNIQVKRNLEGQSENQVRLMTVHAAKGLQAPIVFLPDMTQVPTAKSSFYWKPGHDFFIWADLSVRQFSNKIQDFCANDQEMEEYYRLLYVALTRAEDHLYLCGWGTKKELSSTCWYEALRPVIEKLGHQEKDGFVYGHPPSHPDTAKRTTASKQLTDLPLWVHQPVHVEAMKTIRASSEHTHEKEVSMPYAPEAQVRGVLIHKILQHVVGSKTSESVIKDYVAKQTISPSDKEKVLKAVFSVLAHPLFSNKQRFTLKTEINVQGTLNGLATKGVVDLLLQNDQDKVIWALDYKTGHFDASFKTKPPEAYVRQMGIYKMLLSKIYKTHTIKTGLIWTDIGWLQEL
ncbi:MAG: PD-(D/E)XK nuclease family protein [Holosporaceae bacterium]|nr:MAG: PD-(D/E)XK nuclease family protein [Holosporaceae bacterium]